MSLRSLVGRVLSLRVMIAVVLMGLVGYYMCILRVYRLPGGWFVLAVAAGFALFALSLLVVVERIALARPPAALQPVAAHAEPLIFLLVVNLLILSLLLPVIQGIAAVPLPDSVFRRVVGVAAAVSGRGLSIVFALAALALAWVILLRLLQATVGRWTLFRWMGRALDRLAVALLVLYCLAGVALASNSALDTSPPVPRRAEIVAVASVELPLRLGQFAWADLRDLEPPHRTERLVLLRGQDDVGPHRTAPGQPVRLAMRAGRFGVPWVQAVSVDHQRQAERVLAAVPAAAGVRKALIAELLRERRWREIRPHVEAHLREYPHDREYALKLARALETAGHAADATAITRLVPQ
ncbi:MAG: hypothetical protein ACREJ9_11280 [Candidatus Rokuibacteriota bacterium]